MRRMLPFLFPVFLCFTCMQLQAQTRTAAYQQQRSQASPLAGIPFRNIGPTIMSGRVTDIDVNPDNPQEFYVAYASGGIWFTQNNGQSFVPVFDQEASITVGDMAVNWKEHLLWVGTGEVNSSRSSYAGTGMYQSADSGKHWNYIGLPESHHIGRIVLHPQQKQTAWVAVLGHLYTRNPERGIYKTTDGGQHWTQTLFINDSTGCVDLQADPTNPDILYAAAWSRTRSAWNFNGNGAGSGIYKSTDGGEHWRLLTKEGSGFPTGNGVGRIGLSVVASQAQRIYAILDNQNNQDEKTDKPKKLNARDLASMQDDDFLALDEKDLDAYLRGNGYPEKYTAGTVKEAVKQKQYTVQAVADWKLADADANLFNTPVYGAEIYRSEDGGEHWEKRNEEVLEGVYFTYGYYFGTIQASPQHADRLYIAGYPVLMSEDGGKTFKDIDGENCHPDYHRIWVNPKNDQHVIAGNDGGINISYDAGQHWIKANNPPVGQFYAVTVDEATPYHVYGGLQDNGTWTAPSTTVENTAWHQTGEYPYKNIGDGDGMQVQVDTRDNNTVYTGYQFGNYFKVNQQNGQMSFIKPVHDIGQTPYRFNWQTPILLSKHHQDIFYIGSNKVHRSLHQGENLSAVSPDLTANEKKGNVPYATLTTLSESPRMFGLLYSGSDDGQVSCSQDVGTTWVNRSDGLPASLWVSRVVASAWADGRVYVTLNGYRQDDFRALLFSSDDYGKHWKQLGKDLPPEPLNVVREDPRDSSIVYVGSDNGLYVSFDAGLHFIPWNTSLPRVAVHDLAIQARENELVVGTHGRSLYIASLEEVQAYPSLQNETLALLPVMDMNWDEKLGHKAAVYNEPRSMSCSIRCFSKDSGLHTLRILNAKGRMVYEKQVETAYGFNTFSYDMQVLPAQVHQFKPALEAAEDKKYYVVPGTYTIELRDEQGHSARRDFVLKERKKETHENKEERE